MLPEDIEPEGEDEELPDDESLKQRKCLSYLLLSYSSMCRRTGGAEQSYEKVCSVERAVRFIGSWNDNGTKIPFN